MTKTNPVCMTEIRTWKSVVIWSIISAAFIGPGSVTTAVAAGSSYRLDLLWAVTFSTVACLVVQEVAARITIATGMNVGQTFTLKFSKHRRNTLKWIIGGSVIAGCAAYEAGNILGAVSGLDLLTGLDSVILTVFVTLIAFGLLWKGSPQWIFNLMAILVAVMGISFLYMALTQEFGMWELTKASVVPVIPSGSQLLILGLVGTTVVPYNIFLGSGISHGQTVPVMRVGLSISVIMGGLITAFILVAGTALSGFTSFDALYHDFEVKAGKTAALGLALGLFAAGFASTITAPYGSAIITRTVFDAKEESKVRMVWIGVLLTGFIIGISGVNPIPVIVIVQALNGLILPMLVIFLILVINDSKMIPTEFRHGHFYNAILLIVLGIITLMSLNNVDDALVSAFGLDVSGHFTAVMILTAAIVIVVAKMVYLRKNANDQ